MIILIGNIVTIIKNIFEQAGVKNVYTSFDACPIERKPAGIFTVIGISRYNAESPVYTYSATLVPYTAEVSVKVTAPENMSAGELLTYFGSAIEPVLDNIYGLTCKLSSAAIKFDSTVNRLVLTATLAVGGITRIERSIT